jgi:hypothetical protein
MEANLASLYRELMDDPLRVAGPGELESDELCRTDSRTVVSAKHKRSIKMSKWDMFYQPGDEIHFECSCGREWVSTDRESACPACSQLDPTPESAIREDQADGASLRSGVGSSDAPFDSFERRDRLNDREWEEESHG